METENNDRSNKFTKLMRIAFQFITISSILFLITAFNLKSEVTIITTEVAKKHSPIIIEKKEIIKEEDVIVYDNMTLEELANKLNKSMSGILTNRGTTFAKYAIEYGIDPYLSLAIVLHETGCKWNCSYLATTCNNIGGQKGSPSCGNGSYRTFATLDEGIKGFFDNLYSNYYQYGLTNVYSIHKKYAQDPNWPIYINNYINEIKAK